MRSMSSGALGDPKEKFCSRVVKKRKSSERAKLSPRQRRFPAGIRERVSLEDKIREVKETILESHIIEVEG